jgi:hypothetical protein
MLLQLCYWYRPDEMASRIVLVTILGNFSAVVSGVLAFAFNGVHAQGLSGWKWCAPPPTCLHARLTQVLGSS